MKIYHDIPNFQISWIRKTYNPEKESGRIKNYYIPNDKEELFELIKELNTNKEKYEIIGHTSNIYIQPHTSIKHVISTRKICEVWQDKKYIYCDCGASVKKLARTMINEGVLGFAGLIDLPGTVGGAIYGNSSVGNYSIVNLLDELTIIDGQYLKTIKKSDLYFSFRNSCFKDNDNKKVIISVKLKKKYGYKDDIIKESNFYHQWRMKYQPGPSNNLGTTVVGLEKMTFLGMLLKLIAFIICKLKRCKSNECKIRIIIKFLGLDSKLSTYMFGYNRFIWKDYDAHEYFQQYKRLIYKLYRNPRFEIDIW